MGRRSKIGKLELKRAIREEAGNITRIAERFRRDDGSPDGKPYSRQAIYDRIRECDLWGEVERWRKNLFTMAEGNIFEAVSEGDLDLSKFVLTHFPGGERWSSRQDVNVTGLRLSEEGMRLLEELGIDVDVASEEFEALLRQIANEKAMNDRE
jgi:hypothetical protein